ncbi:Fic family protein [Enterococcus asini]|nr:Fic family protein [Enterococcus asini]
MSKPSLAASLAEILDNLNYMHSFREGNGRTQREVVRVLA